MISAALRATRAASRCANGNRTRREQTRPRDTGATRRFSLGAPAPALVMKLAQIAMVLNLGGILVVLLLAAFVAR